MKKIFYSIYAIMFNIFRLFPLKQNKVTFLSPHNACFNDSLGEVMENVIRRDEFIIKRISCKVLDIDSSNAKALFFSLKDVMSFFTIKAFHLATSKFIFMNDNFMPMAKLKFKDDAVITQLWHAEGAFKKFGLHINQPDEIRSIELEGNKKLSYVVCSSQYVAQIYSEAFGVPEERVLPLGSPRTDYFFRRVNKNRLREKIDARYPECKGKKIVLYAPTFRDNKEEDSRLLESIDINAFNKRFGSTCVLLVRLHPQVHTSVCNLDGAVYVGDYENVSELLRIADVLITDYSSICMDFALMEKPVFFYAFDLQQYDVERSFYYDYEAYVPGPVARDFQTILNLLDSSISETYSNRMRNFRFLNFGNPDGHAAQRVVDRIIYNKE